MFINQAGERASERAPNVRRPDLGATSGRALGKFAPESFGWRLERQIGLINCALGHLLGPRDSSLPLALGVILFRGRKFFTPPKVWPLALHFHWAPQRAKVVARQQQQQQQQRMLKSAIMAPPSGAR